MVVLCVRRECTGKLVICWRKFDIVYIIILYNPCISSSSSVCIFAFIYIRNNIPIYLRVYISIAREAREHF